MTPPRPASFSDRAVLTGIACALLGVGCSPDPPRDPDGASARADDRTSPGGRGGGPVASKSFSPDDSAKFAALLRECGLSPIPSADTRSDSGGTDDRGALAIFPRGKIRAADLESFRIETDYALRGTLRFEKSDGRVYEGALETDELNTVRPVPAEVRNALKVGDHVTWSFTPATGAAATADFEVVDSTPDGRVADAMRRVDPSQADLARQLEAHALLELGLNQAAYAEASAVGRASSSRPAWRIALAALQRIHAASSRLGDEAREQLIKIDSDAGRVDRKR